MWLVFSFYLIRFFVLGLFLAATLWSVLVFLAYLLPITLKNYCKSVICYACLHCTFCRPVHPKTTNFLAGQTSETFFLYVLVLFC